MLHLFLLRCQLATKERLITITVQSNAQQDTLKEKDERVTDLKNQQLELNKGT